MRKVARRVKMGRKETARGREVIPTQVEGSATADSQDDKARWRQRRTTAGEKSIARKGRWEREIFGGGRREENGRKTGAGERGREGPKRKPGRGPRGRKKREAEAIQGRKNKTGEPGNTPKPRQMQKGSEASKEDLDGSTETAKGRQMENMRGGTNQQKREQKSLKGQDSEKTRQEEKTDLNPKKGRSLDNLIKKKPKTRSGKNNGEKSRGR